jgi:hypothetical protein
MEILGYGEDALTLWAIQNKLGKILSALGELEDKSKLRVLFRPSFGRSGGSGSSQFGEFDFIVLCNRTLLLGESKWDGSSEKVTDGKLNLRAEQILRHQIFKFYVQEWSFGKYSSWAELETKGHIKMKEQGIQKPIAPVGSLLAANLQTVLGMIKEHFNSLPNMVDVLLYLHRGLDDSLLPSKGPDSFRLIALDYSTGTQDNFVKIKL